jgi:hypothetical protein
VAVLLLVLGCRVGVTLGFDWRELEGCGAVVNVFSRAALAIADLPIGNIVASGPIPHFCSPCIGNHDGLGAGVLSGGVRLDFDDLGVRVRDGASKRHDDEKVTADSSHEYLPWLFDVMCIYVRLCLGVASRIRHPPRVFIPATDVVTRSGDTDAF